jgi:hypothetical protein
MQAPECFPVDLFLLLPTRRLGKLLPDFVEGFFFLPVHLGQLCLVRSRLP